MSKIGPKQSGDAIVVRKAENAGSAKYRSVTASLSSGSTGSLIFLDFLLNVGLR